MPRQTKQGHATGPANKPQCLPRCGRGFISWRTALFKNGGTKDLFADARLSFPSKKANKGILCKR